MLGFYDHTGMSLSKKDVISRQLLLCLNENIMFKILQGFMDLRIMKTVISYNYHAILKIC